MRVYLIILLGLCCSSMSAQEDHGHFSVVDMQRNVIETFYQHDSIFALTAQGDSLHGLLESLSDSTLYCGANSIQYAQLRRLQKLGDEGESIIHNFERKGLERTDMRWIKVGWTGEGYTMQIVKRGRVIVEVNPGDQVSLKLKDNSVLKGAFTEIEPHKLLIGEEAIAILAIKQIRVKGSKSESKGLAIALLVVGSVGMILGASDYFLEFLIPIGLVCAAVGGILLLPDQHNINGNKSLVVVPQRIGS